MNRSSRKDNFFSRDQLKVELKKRSVHSALNKMITSGASIIITLASAMILARLLAPEVFGIFAMVYSFTEIARYLMEVGIGTAIVQKEDITHEEVSALFWINCFIGLVLALAVAAASPAIAWFYDDSSLIKLCLALSLTFFFRGILVEHRALLERQMHFGYLGIINISSNFLSFAVAVIFAWIGFGVWSLVWRELVYVFLYAAGTWIFCRWIPSLPNFSTNVISSLKFGFHLSGVSFIQYLTQNVDKILIGRFAGATPLGLYSKAQQLAMMPIVNIQMIFWDVGLSPLSTLQNDAERYKRFFGRMIAIQSFIYLPIIVFIALESKNVIQLMLGDAWIEGAPILRIFAVAGFVTPIIATLQLVMVSCGNTRRFLSWGIISGFLTITSYVICIHWGAIGVAYASASTSYILFLSSFAYCLINTPINASVVIKNILPIAISCLGAGIILKAMLPEFSFSNIIFDTTASFFVFSLIYLVILFLIPTGRKQLTEFLSYRKEFFSR